MNEVLVLKATCYSFTDEKTGELKQGASVTFCKDLSGGKTKDNEIGIDVVTSRMPYECFIEVPEAPAFYNMEFGFKQDRKTGKPELVVESLKWSRSLVSETVKAKS